MIVSLNDKFRLETTLSESFDRDSGSVSYYWYNIRDIKTNKLLTGRIFPPIKFPFDHDEKKMVLQEIESFLLETN